MGSVATPYPYIKFDKQIQRMRKEYNDPNSKHATSRLNVELQDVTTIMKKNIQDVLDRGQRLETTQEYSAKMVSDSKKFAWGAKKLNKLALLRKWAPIVFLVLFVLLFIYIRLYWL